jgi:hypothetical protein
MADLTGLGRRHAPDPRDKAYRLTAPQPTVSRKSWLAPAVLDQGNTSECVGHASRALLNAGPIVNKGGPDQHLIYREARKVDEWPGEAYDGTSVRGAMKYLNKSGFIGEYHWAFTLNDIVEHCLTRGPVQMGTTWFEEMFTPDRWGYIQPQGEPVGGHSWLVGLSIDLGAPEPRRHPRPRQDAELMGRGWGNNGRAWLTLAHLRNS